MQQEVAYGKEASKLSMQRPHSKMLECPKCGKEAELFMAIEESGVCAAHLHPNDGAPGGWWFHDAATFALYCCRGCFNVFVQWNQG
jgi:hypothetical protein